MWLLLRSLAALQAASRKVKALVVAGSMVAATVAPMAAADVGSIQKGTINSEVRTGTSGADGTRVSADSEWTKFTVPENCVINKDATKVSILEERGSEHSYEIKYEDDTEVVKGTNLKQPRTISVKTHARSDKGPKGGSGKMSVKVEFEYVQFK